MPPRDEQDYEQRRQQIIDGALHVFSQKGFERATNKDIAEAAKIGSPGLIYHYFKDKADLFTQVVEERAPALQFIMRGDDVMDLPPREVLTRFAQAFMETISSRSSIAMFKLMLSESIRHPHVAEVFNRAGPGRGFDFLARYLEHQMDKGTLRRMDTGAAVRCFIGPMLAFLITREVIVQRDSAALSAETMVQSAIDVFLEGMQPRNIGTE